MKREDVLSVLLSHRAQLNAMGVRRAALFGSMARGMSTAASDIDILVDLDEAADTGVYEYVGIVQFINGLFSGRVDVAHLRGLKDGLRDAVERDAIYAF